MPNRTKLVLLLLLISLGSNRLAWAEKPLPFYRAESVFQYDQSLGKHTHASSIIECPNGDLLVVWYENGDKLKDPRYFSRQKDKSDDVRIAGSRKVKGTNRWEKPFVMSDTFGTADNNPTIAIDKKNQLWLFHSTMLGAPKWTWSSSILQYKISSNYNKPGAPQWNKTGLLLPRPVGLKEVVDDLAKRLKQPEVRKLLSGKQQIEAHAWLFQMYRWLEDPMHLRLGWMPRAHPLVRSDGALLVPLSNENFEIPMMAITKDSGTTWTFSKPVPEAMMIQPAVVEYPDGQLVAFFRNGDPRHRVKRSSSKDGGMTWTKPELTDRPHPGGGVDALLLKSGNLALVYNNKEQGPRDKLAISISTDRGKTFNITRQLEDQTGGRFDYPSIIQTKQGIIHISYTYNLKTIKHVSLNEEWIRQEK